MRHLLYLLLLLSAVAGPAQAGDSWLAPPPGWSGETVTPNTAATVATAAPASGLRIVVMGPSRRFAVIDGRTVRTGSDFNGAKVVGIQSDAVLLSREGQVEQLRSNPAVIKKVHESTGKAGMAGKERGEKQ
jgi:hypothetical protein